MYKSRILIIVIFFFSSCSLLKQSPKTVDFIVDQQQLDLIINKSVSELISANWLSDYLVENNERPILVVSKFKNNTNIFIDTLRLYETIDMDLIRTGQVRVVKLDENQRQISPVELVKGHSIDYVISTKIEKIVSETSSSYIFGLSLWNDKLAEPILTIVNKIE